MSARLPGAIMPRSLRPKARAAERRCAISGERFAAEADELAEHEVQMALFGDVEQVVGAEGQEREVRTSRRGCQRVQVLRDRAFAYQDGHALADLLERFFRRGRLVVRARRQVAVEVEPRTSGACPSIWRPEKS